MPIVIETTCPDTASAEAIARALIEERLAACAHIGGEIGSVYRWKGEVACERETPLSFKTRTALFVAAADRIAALHPYETPAITSHAIPHVSEDYARWIEAETRAG